MILARALLLGLALLPLPAAAQQAAAPSPPAGPPAAAPASTAPPRAAPAPIVPPGAGTGVPEALRGAWFAGASCDAPEAMLFLTARGGLLVTATGAPALRRFATIGIVPGGWTLGTASGPQAARWGLRSPGPDRLDLLEPAAKTRDDRLPGEGAAVTQWRRCATLSPAMVARFGEAIDALVVLEQVEAACGPGALIAECLASLVARLDVTGDGGLSVAELARFGRGAAQLAALQSGNAVPADAADAALTAARRLVDGLDYDGDGKLSQAELLQDRASLGVTPAVGGPLATLPAVPGLDMILGRPPAR